MSKIKAGDEVYTSNRSQEDCFERQTNYIQFYLFTDTRGEHHVRTVHKQSSIDDVLSWKFMTAVPAKKKIPYTFETFPKVYTLVKFLGVKYSLHYIQSIGIGGVSVAGNHYPFASMTTEIELSFDAGETWLPFYLEE